MAKRPSPAFNYTMSTFLNFASAMVGLAFAKSLADSRERKKNSVTATAIAVSDIENDEVVVLEDNDAFDVDAAVAELVVKSQRADPHQQPADRLKRASDSAKKLVWMRMAECSAPAVVVGVAVNGKPVWKHGFGFADVENQVGATPNTVMRIASISKSMTIAALGRLMDEGSVELDKSVFEYVPEWPKDSEKGRITTRQLVSHTSGIRHYTKKGEKDDDDGPTDGSGDGRFREFHIKDKYKTVGEALNLFKDDELLSEPGKEFNYTTHGFTLLSAVIEAVSGETFENRMKRTFNQLGMDNTFLDENEPIIPNRARYYVRDKHHRLRNAPYVDNSCKWAGGGFISTVHDLVRFGNAMLYSFQHAEAPLPPSTVQKEAETQTKTALELQREGNAEKTPEKDSVLNRDPLDSNATRVEENTWAAKNVVFRPGPYHAVNTEKNRAKKLLPGYLSRNTVMKLWEPVMKMSKDPKSLSEARYGMGWAVLPRSHEHAFGRNQKFCAFHTGGAVGASSVLLIIPREGSGGASTEVYPTAVRNNPPPQGVVVSIICNLQSVGLTKLALDIAREFDKELGSEGPVKIQRIYEC